MDPKDFNWTEDQQVTVSNPTEADFQFKVHNKDYVLPAGRTAKMPGYMAWVFVYNLASQLCQRDEHWGEWNDLAVRQRYYDKLTVGVDSVMQTVEVEEPSPVEVLDGGTAPAPVEEPTEEDSPVADPEPVSDSAANAQASKRARSTAKA